MLTLRSVPTYEYECPKCPRVFEVKQRISEPALTTCDRCGGPIHRLLSATPFILKGGGWYVTDYPSESRKKALSSESGGKLVIVVGIEVQHGRWELLVQLALLRGLGRLGGSREERAEAEPAREVLRDRVGPPLGPNPPRAVRGLRAREREPATRASAPAQRSRSTTKSATSTSVSLSSESGKGASASFAVCAYA